MNELMNIITLVNLTFAQCVIPTAFYYTVGLLWIMSLSYLCMMEVSFIKIQKASVQMTPQMKPSITIEDVKDFLTDGYADDAFYSLTSEDEQFDVQRWVAAYHLSKLRDDEDVISYSLITEEEAIDHPYPWLA